MVIGSTNGRWRNSSVLYNCNRTRPLRWSIRVTSIAGRGNGNVVWTSSKDLSNRIRATPRSRQISPILSSNCGCGKKPSAQAGMRSLLGSIVNGSGDIKEAQRVLATFPAENKILVNSNFGDVRSMAGDRAYVFVLARDFEAALKVWEAPGNTAVDERRRLSARVAIRVLGGDLIGAQAEGEKARQLLEERLRERPNDISSMTQLSWVYLALKRNGDATKLARQAANLLPPEKDVVVGNILLAGLGEMEARTGATADAIALLRRLLSVPAGGSVSVARLKIDPVWDPIRSDPGFQELLTMKEYVGP